MRIGQDRTVRALVFGVAADSAVNLRLTNGDSSIARTLTFNSTVPGGSAEINVHHNATGDINIGGGSNLGNVTLNDPLLVTHNGSGFLAISRPISGSHAITKSGDGEVELTGTNSSFSGDLNIQEGKLALKSTGSEDGQPDVYVASGATLSLGSGFIGKTATIGNLTGAGKVDPQFNSGSGTRTLQVNQTADGTFSGTLQNATTGGRTLALKKTGPATLTLSGANSYTGGTTVTGGVLRVAGDSALGAVPGSASVNLTLDDGGIKNNNSTPVLHANRTISLGNGGGWFTSGWNKSTTFDGRITGAGALTVNNDSGVVVFTNGGNDYAGNTTIGGELPEWWNPNATLRLGTSEVLPHGSGKGNVVFNASAGGTAILDLNGQFETVNMLSTTGGGAARVIGGGTLTVGANNASGTFAGTLQDALALMKTGSGQWALTGDNSYTGNTWVNEGILRIEHPGALGAAAGFTELAGGGATSTLEIAGGITVAEPLTVLARTTGDAHLRNVGGDNTLSGNISWDWGGNRFNVESLAGTLIVLDDTGPVGGNDKTFHFSGAGNVDFRGAIGDSGTPTNVHKSVGGTLILTGANTYTGGTTVDAGTVNVAGNQSAATGGWTIGKGNATAGAVNFQAGSTVAVGAGETIQVGSIPGDTVVSTASQALNLAGSVSNDGTLAIGRRATVSVNNGATWTQNGNMSIDGIGGYPAWLNVNAGGLFTYAGGSSIKVNPGAAGGPGGLTIDGTFVTGQGFERTAEGGAVEVWLDGGTLRLSGDVADLTVNSGAKPFTFAVAAGGGTIDTDGHLAGVGGIISGSGALTKSGAGTLTFSAANTYRGTTTVSEGTLLVNGDQSAATGAVTVAGGATLGGTGTVGGAVTVQSVGTLSPGGSVGTLALASDLTIDGGAQLNFELGTTDSDLVTLGGSLDLSDGWVLKIVDAGDNSGSPGLYELFSYGSIGTLSQPTYNLGDIGDLGWTAERLTVIDGGDGSVYLQVLPPVLQVAAVDAAVSGVDIHLTGDLDPSTLNLYDGPDSAPDLRDVTFVGDNVGPVDGSLVWDAPARTLHFVKTGGPLSADHYTLTLASRSDGLIDTLGRPLDGDADGIPGGDYTTTLTVDAAEPVVVSLPDFTRGPGQPVDVPPVEVADGDDTAGLPLYLSEAAGVTSVTLDIQYDPALLTITGAQAGPGLPVGAGVEADTSVAGVVGLQLTSPESLPAGPVELITLIADVPSSATYGATHVLDVSAPSINGGAIPVTADDALHVAANLGDTTGNQTYSGLDAQRVARVVVHLDSGFDAFPLIDPVVIADATRNGALSGFDAQRIAQESVGLDPPEIPPFPQPLRLDRSAVGAEETDPLTHPQLALAVSTAVARVQSAAREDAEPLPAVTFEILDLPGNLLGLTSHHTIQIDVNAAGYGWFVDTSPWDDLEFVQTDETRVRTALPGSPAADRADLLTVVMHELGHVLGHPHEDRGVMEETLPLGTRRVWNDRSSPEEAADIDKVFAEPDLSPTVVDILFATT
jgi:autotransporter-associated beta strand protein